MAMQFGRPAIATKVGSIDEIVRHGFNGLIVPPCDSRALADAIMHLVSDQDRARIFAENSLRLAKHEFAWTSIAERTTEVYKFAQIRQVNRE